MTPPVGRAPQHTAQDGAPEAARPIHPVAAWGLALLVSGAVWALLLSALF